MRGLGDRRFAALWAGQLVSLSGDGVYAALLPIMVLRTGGGPESVGLVLTAFGVPRAVLLPVAGAVVERLPACRVVLFGHLIEALAALSLAVVLAFADATLSQLAAVSASLGVCASFTAPAGRAMVPGIVATEDLLAANAALSIAGNISGVAGPAIGGLLALTTPLWVGVTVDAVTFLIAAHAMTWIGAPSVPRQDQGASGSLLRDIGVGCRFVKDTRWLRAGIGVAAVVNFVYSGAIQVALPVLATTDLASPADYGWLLATSAVGATAAGAVLARCRPQQPTGVWAYGPLALAGLMVAGLGVVADGLGVVWLGFPLGAMLALYSATWETALMRGVPTQLMARVISIEMAGSLALQPVGYILTGAIVAADGPRLVLLVAGAVVSVVSLAALASLSARTFGDPVGSR